MKIFDRCAVLLLPVVFLCSCDWLWPREAEYDPWRCSPQCPAGEYCRGGECVTGDGPRGQDNRWNDGWIAGDFGGLCDTHTKCASSLLCVLFSASTTGYCTKTCTNLQGPCSGAPSGTVASCSLQLQTPSGLKYICGFDCGSAKCPTGMTCETSSAICKP